ALLLLPLGRARPAADLVQVARVPGPHRPRATGGAAGVRARARPGRRDPRVGLELGSPLLRAAAASGRHRGARRGPAGEAGHARLDDGHGHPGPGRAVSDRPGSIADALVADADGAVAPPRSNGELVFEAPWESRAFGVAVALSEARGLEWERFRQGLI